MKKLLLVCLWFISVSVIAQEIAKPYAFPVRPGSEQWAELSTSKQMDEVCVVPGKVLESLSTEALLMTCLDYPRLPDVFCANDMQAGFEFYANHFNGLKELLNRPDLNQVLLNYYPEIDVNKSTITLDPGQPSFFKTAFFELMISQDQVLAAYKKAEKNKLLSLSRKNLELRRSKGESVGRQVSTALLLSRILSTEDPSFKKSMQDNEVLNAFNSKGIVFDLGVVDQVYLAAEQADNSID